MSEGTVPSVGERIRELRKDEARGQTMTRAALAAAADVSVDVIRKLEQPSADYTASIPTLQRIGTALDVDIAELFRNRRAPPGRGVGRRLAALFRSRPEIIERILTEHADDGAGRCRSCSSDAQAGRYPYPCSVRLAADEALRRLEEDVGRVGAWTRMLVIAAAVTSAAARQRSPGAWRMAPCVGAKAPTLRRTSVPIRCPTDRMCPASGSDQRH